MINSVAELILVAELSLKSPKYLAEISALLLSFFFFDPLSAKYPPSRSSRGFGEKSNRSLSVGELLDYAGRGSPQPDTVALLGFLPPVADQLEIRFRKVKRSMTKR